MKNMLVLLLILLISPAFLMAQDEDLPAGSAIYFYRLPNYYGAAIQMKIMINDQPVVRLKNGSFYRHEVLPGEYLLSSKMASISQLKITVEPGQSYYVKAYINPGFWSGIPVLELVDNQAGRAIIDGGMLTEQEYAPVPVTRLKSRAGLYFSGGVGFEKIDLGYTDEGDDLTLSTGGGFAVGAEYGYELSRQFDLSFNLFYQGSTLTPAVKNASASFNRIGITMTPALIIPVKGGEYLRFRLGAGPGFYGGGKMKVDFSDAGGGKFEMKYKPAAGIHGSLVFESNFSDRGSFSLGIKYYHINYSYTSTGSTGSSTDPIIISPDGSGLDFLMGYYFRF